MKILTLTMNPVIDKSTQAEMVLPKKKNNPCEVIVLSLGSKGSMLIQQNKKPEYIIPLAMPVKSAVGAGDSMVGGIITGLIQGMNVSEATQYGVAAGTAATLTEGSQLCRKEDTEEIFERLKSSRIMNDPNEQTNF